MIADDTDDRLRSRVLTARITFIGDFISQNPDVKLSVVRDPSTRIPFRSRAWRGGDYICLHSRYQVIPSRLFYRTAVVTPPGPLSLNADLPHLHHRSPPTIVTNHVLKAIQPLMQQQIRP